MSRWYAIALVGASAWTVHAQTAGTGPTRAPSTLKVNARLVVLDVVVTDQAGKPVEGLTAGDLQIFEDGKLQQIQSFEPPTAHNLPTATASAGVAAVFDPARPASFGRSPVDVLVLDDLNTHFGDSLFARRSLHDYLAGQPAVLSRPATLLSVDDRGYRQLQAFTRHRDLLLRALAAAPAAYDWKLEIDAQTGQGPIERLDGSLRALQGIAQSYARIAGRKDLIWVGGGFPRSTLRRWTEMTYRR